MGIQLESRETTSQGMTRRRLAILVREKVKYIPFENRKVDVNLAVLLKRIGHMSLEMIRFPLKPLDIRRFGVPFGKEEEIHWQLFVVFKVEAPSFDAFEIAGEGVHLEGDVVGRDGDVVHQTGIGSMEPTFFEFLPVLIEEVVSDIGGAVALGHVPPSNQFTGLWIGLRMSREGRGFRQYR